MKDWTMITRGAGVIMAAATVLFQGCWPTAGGKRDSIAYRQLLEPLQSLDYLARLDVPETEILTSSDPTGGNDDFNHPLKTGHDGWVVLADLKGPGYVSRFWFTGSEPKHRVRFYFDNEKQPRIDMAIGDFCGGADPFTPPLAAYENYCWYNYVPIPYAKRLVIETQQGGSRPDGGPKLFHQINYSAMPSGKRVESFKLPLPADAQTQLDDIRKQWGNPSQFRAEATVLAATNFVINPSEESSLAIGPGPAIISEIILARDLTASPPLAGEAVLRDVILKIHWDASEQPSVAVPVGSFFGSVWMASGGQSVFFGATNGTFYTRFPMPFKTVATIAFENQTSVPVKFALAVKGRKLESWNPQCGYFHAAWNRSKHTSLGSPHNVLTASGHGRYAGCILSAISLDKSFWLLEGDETMERDGEQSPFWRGTGLEDYFNGGWYYQNVLCRPLHGLLFKSFFRTVQYRIHLPDPVLFNKSFSMSFERGPENRSHGWLESTAFYYMNRPQPSGSTLLTPRDRVPPVDEPQVAGFMLDLFNCERFGAYVEAMAAVDVFLAKYPSHPYAEMLALRKVSYRERMEGFGKTRAEFVKATTEAKDNAVRDNAKLLLWYHEKQENALLSLNANMPARCMLDGKPVLETSDPAKLAVAPLQLAPGRHVIVVQCRFHPYPAWVQACIRSHCGDIATSTSWKQCVGPSGDWAAVDYDDSAWTVTGGTGCKGPPEEPFVWIEPNAFIGMQSHAAAIYSAVDWPDKSKPLVLRHVFDIPAQGAVSE